MQSPPQIRIYLFTHRNWRIVRNDPASPIHRYWAIRPRAVDHRGVEIQPSKQFGPFPLWSAARETINVELDK